MSPTLLEAAVAIVLIVVAWQIGLAIAPSILRSLRGLKRDVDEVVDQVAADEGTTDSSYQRKEEQSNGTRHTY